MAGKVYETETRSAKGTFELVLETKEVMFFEDEANGYLHFGMSGASGNFPCVGSIDKGPIEEIGTIVSVISHCTCKVPENKRDAKMMDMELVDVTTSDVFGDEKTLLFIQTLNGKEYKIDYSKTGTSMFIKIHQDSTF